MQSQRSSRFPNSDSTVSSQAVRFAATSDSQSTAPHPPASRQPAAMPSTAASQPSRHPPATDHSQLNSSSPSLHTPSSPPACRSRGRQAARPKRAPRASSTNKERQVGSKLKRQAKYLARKAFQRAWSPGRDWNANARERGDQNPRSRQRTISPSVQEDYPIPLPSRSREEPSTKSPAAAALRNQPTISPHDVPATRESDGEETEDDRSHLNGLQRMNRRIAKRILGKELAADVKGAAEELQRRRGLRE
ncbi:unnamed protein product [Zymoseptoria tritici ST99CH_3D1]|nr:unnamed protein product [Zymoseptoria tritici ST99CH_3D1]